MCSAASLAAATGTVSAALLFQSVAVRRHTARVGLHLTLPLCSLLTQQSTPGHWAGVLDVPERRERNRGGGCSLLKRERESECVCVCVCVCEGERETIEKC